jgi:sugar/nucleoside kinase (ribokinase family)
MKSLDIFCVAEVAIDHIADAGSITDNASSTLLHSVKRYYGGMGGNFSAVASIFGVKVGILAAIGRDDPDSIDYKKYLENRNIDTDYLLQEEWSSISKCFIFNEKEKQRLFFYPGTATQHTEKYMKYAMNLAEEVKSEALYAAFTDFELNKFYLSRGNARIKAYAPAHNTHRHSRKDFSECLEHTDVLFVNENEAAIMENIMEKNIFEIADDFGIGVVARTMGKDGCEIIIDGKPTAITACRINRMLDPSGAGDAFAGAFMANYIKGGDAINSAKIASATASFIVEERGCQTGIPSIDALQERIKRNYGDIILKE